MLKIRNITVQYNKKDKPAVEDFSLNIKQGEICCLVGESGSGKTSVVRAVQGNLPGQGCVSQGDILFEGQSLLNYTENEWRKIRGTEISMIFQDSGAMMNPIRTIGSQFVEYIRAHGVYTKRQAWVKGVQMLKSVRLPDGEQIMNSYPFQLSGGMKQRVGIAFAMFFQPKLLLADEPTSALDVTTQAQIVRQMMKLREDYGTSIIMITHNLALAAYMCDHIVVMKDGKIADSGDRNHILHNSQAEYTKELLSAVPSLGGGYYV
ncbi:ABC transporter ATP-binding protein [Clostridium boliviensis]|uniref:ABC transporter ATP-binding protein n=1 Tax=Clostridium boliviensis TaxID=318465 RepID=A0ABU4GU91_9CLOT|nr:ABC transporter ATP-binding protein [Clostridium boliviensis]MDW2800565.1 ABC transporter ATP-binding protein [Clostridium boliviensis]